MVMMSAGQAVSVKGPGTPDGKEACCLEDFAADDFESTDGMNGQRNGRLRRSSVDAVCNERTSDPGRQEEQGELGAGCVQLDCAAL